MPLDLEAADFEGTVSCSAKLRRRLSVDRTFFAGPLFTELEDIFAGDYRWVRHDAIANIGTNLGGNGTTVLATGGNGAAALNARDALDGSEDQHR